ncbi:MAG TPA: pitrilysin family protein [Polyangiaceae bacterium]
MQAASLRQAGKIQKQLETLNQKAPEHGKLEFVESVAFGSSLAIDRYRLQNGLAILLCEDKSAPVVSVHTWFRVGSRHEQEGKTGLAHLFEHLMFNEIEGRGPGEFDRKLEEAGAESNASTWLDWTQYNIAIPKEQLGLVLELEAERMSKLVLREPQVTSEKEVVANERRYRVDDDVEGAVSELLWATAFTRHAYKWPTIGWMKDIEGFTTQDCESFYRAYYAPNNAVLVISGDFKAPDVLRLISQHYGAMPGSSLPLEDSQPEPPQTSERRLEVRKPTSTEKLVLGYHAPALGDFDHPAISLLSEVLFGGRASRLHQRLVRELELASEVRAFVGPFHDPGLFELFVAAREGHTAEELLAVLDEELKKVTEVPVSAEEMARASARFELGLLGGLETADGKASTIGFYEAVLGRPAAAFERLEATRRLTQSDLLRAARRYLDPRQRSVIFVRPELGKAGAEAAQ